MNSNNCAFPFKTLNSIEMGLSKREFTAVLLLQGLLSAPGGTLNIPPGEKIKWVKKAVELADCLLQELENPIIKKGN